MSCACHVTDARCLLTVRTEGKELLQVRPAGLVSACVSSFQMVLRRHTAPQSSFQKGGCFREACMG